MDDADWAQIEIERQEEALRYRLSLGAGKSTWAVVCVECGDDLHPFRREYGLCIECATARERRAAQCVR